MRLLKLLGAALAVITVAPSLALAYGSLNQCSPAEIASSSSGTALNGLALTSSRSFAWSTDERNAGWGILDIWIDLTDGDTSITRLDVTCTVSHDGNSTDYTPQECTSSSGTYTCVDTGVWQKASPGTKKLVYRLDVEGLRGAECTFSVGAGSGGSSDLITVKRQLCTKG